MILTTLEKHSERVRIRRSAINSGFPEEAKAGQATRKMQKLLKGSNLMLESFKESAYIPKTESINSQINDIHQYITIEEDYIINDI
jgi:hypothetical protein